MVCFVTVAGHRIDLGTVPVDIGLLVQDVLHTFERRDGKAAGFDEFVDSTMAMVRRRFPVEERRNDILNGPAGEIIRDCALRLHFRQPTDAWPRDSVFNPVRLLFDCFILEGSSQASFARQADLSPSTLSGAFRFFREWGEKRDPTDPRMTVETLARTFKNLGVTPRLGRLLMPEVEGERGEPLENGGESLTAREAALIHLCGTVGRFLSSTKAADDTRIAVEALAFHLALMFGIADETTLAQFVQDILRAFRAQPRVAAVTDGAHVALFELGLSLAMDAPLPFPPHLATELQRRLLATLERGYEAVPNTDEGSPAHAFRSRVAAKWNSGATLARTCALLLCPTPAAQEAQPKTAGRTLLKLVSAQRTTGASAERRDKEPRQAAITAEEAVAV